MIMGWLAAAREHCEDFLGLSLSPRVLEIALDRFPTTALDGRTYFEFPMGPVTGAATITAPDASGDSDDTDADPVDTATYALDDYSDPARIYPLSTWPSFTAGTNAIRVRYPAGYAIDSDGVSAMPAKFRAAILLVLGHLYAHREENVREGASAACRSASRRCSGLAVRSWGWPDHEPAGRPPAPPRHDRGIDLVPGQRWRDGGGMGRPVRPPAAGRDRAFGPVGN